MAVSDDALMHLNPWLPRVNAWRARNVILAVVDDDDVVVVAVPVVVVALVGCLSSSAVVVLESVGFPVVCHSR